MSKNYYDILGLSKSATADEIKRAYRKLAHQYHPDKGGSAEDERKFKEVSEAYQVLSNTEKRQQYDQYGQAFDQRSRSGGQAGGFDGFDFSDFTGPEGAPFGGFGGFGDIFEDFFGQAFSQVQAEVSVSPAQAVLGDKLSLSIGGEKVEINLPAGIQTGTTFRIPGKGKSYKGGQKGDLLLTVKIEMPKRLSNQQKELWEQLRNLDKNGKRSWWG
jgi:curved DNA-binding protein